MTKITVTNLDAEADIETGSIPDVILAVGFLQQILSAVVEALRQQDADKGEE